MAARVATHAFSTSQKDSHVDDRRQAALGCVRRRVLGCRHGTPFTQRTVLLLEKTRSQEGLPVVSFSAGDTQPQATNKSSRNPTPQHCAPGRRDTAFQGTASARTITSPRTPTGVSSERAPERRAKKALSCNALPESPPHPSHPPHGSVRVRASSGSTPTSPHVPSSSRSLRKLATQSRISDVDTSSRLQAGLRTRSHCEPASACGSPRAVLREYPSCSASEAERSFTSLCLPDVTSAAACRTSGNEPGLRPVDQEELLLQVPARKHQLRARVSFADAGPRAPSRVEGMKEVRWQADREAVLGAIHGTPRPSDSNRLPEAADRFAPRVMTR